MRRWTVFGLAVLIGAPLLAIGGLLDRPGMAASTRSTPGQPGACHVARADHPIPTRPGRTVSVFSPVGPAAPTGGSCSDRARPPVFANTLNPRLCPPQPCVTNAPGSALFRDLNLPVNGSQTIRFEVGDDSTAAVALSITVASNSPSLLPSSSFVLGADSTGQFRPVSPAAGMRGEGSFPISVSYGSNAAELTAAVRVGVPAPPQRPLTSPAENAAVVSWQVPVYNGGAAIDQYIVTASPGARR